MESTYQYVVCFEVSKQGVLSVSCAEKKKRKKKWRRKKYG